MFPKKFRLPAREMRGWTGKVFASPYFRLNARGNALDHNRYGVVISKKSVPKSTRRHFWKRTFLFSFCWWPNFNKDFLVIVRPEIEFATRQGIRTELEEIARSMR